MKDFVTERPTYSENEAGDIVPYDDNPDDEIVRFSEKPDDTEYMVVRAAASEAARKLLEIVTPEKESDLQEVGVAERIFTVEERFGFLPRSPRELSDIYDLTGKILPGGAATHLNTVFKRQKQFMDEPDRTVRSIVGRYGNYAKNARVEHGLLKQLEEETDGVNAERLGKDWRHSGSLSRPLLHIMSTRDVTGFMQDGDGVNPLKALTDGNKYSLSNTETVQHVQEIVDNSEMMNFEGELKHSLLSEQNRFQFWVNALQEARQHSLARGIAYGILIELGVEKAE